MRINVLFCGLVRMPELFVKSINDLVVLKRQGLIDTIAYSTWNTEIDKYNGLREFLIKSGIKLIESIEPQFQGSSIFHQMISFESGLQNFADDSYVLKTRPDVYIKTEFIRMLASDENFLDIPNTGPGVIFKKKIWIPWFEITKPFYMGDEAFFGLNEDMKNLVNYDVSYDIKYKSDAGIGHIRRYIHPFLKDYPSLQEYLGCGVKTGHNTDRRFDILRRNMQSDHYWEHLALYYLIVNKHFRISSDYVPQQIQFRLWSNPKITIDEDKFDENFTIEKSWNNERGQIYAYNERWLKSLLGRKIGNGKYLANIYDALTRQESRYMILKTDSACELSSDNKSHCNLSDSKVGNISEVSQAALDPNKNYSNLIDVESFFDGIGNYVILKLPDDFPNYCDHSDIDILCGDVERFKAHILEKGKVYESQGFKIEVTKNGENTHIDFYPPRAQRLNFRFDLIDDLTYEKFQVSPELACIVLDNRKRINKNDVWICVPSIEYDLAIRLMEYVEYKDDRPDKIKHLNYVSKFKMDCHLNIINKYTDMQVSLDRMGENVSLNVHKKELAVKSPDKKRRMDYFMIWGHGLQYTNEILDIIRNVEDFKIVAIIKRHVQDIEQFIQDVYACDTVPFEHLVSKTRYLLGTKPEVLFILIENNNTQEKYFGEGAFRHIQCQLIKDVKEVVRNKFNPRANGKRTEHHVIHASDYESQVEHVLKVLGLQPLSYFTREPNSELDVPYHIEPFDDYEIREIDVNDIVAEITGLGLVGIKETPHFKYLTGDKKHYIGYHSSYFGTYLTDDHFSQAFDNMILNFQYGQKTNSNKLSLILVRPLENNKYRIMDGVHRASILAFKGIEKISVVIPSFSAVKKSQQYTPGGTNSVISTVEGDIKPFKLVGVIFSKDRAMQLQGTLDSFYLNCRDAQNIDLVVLYRTTSELHHGQYKQLKKKYNKVLFLEEYSFKKQLNSVVKTYEYVLFLVDDNIFIRPFGLQDICSHLENDEQTLGFSLRLGRNTNFCYPFDEAQTVPPFVEIDIDVLRYSWPGQQYDFGYPLEVSSSVFRCKDMVPLLEQCEFSNPNELEGMMDRAKQNYEFRPYLLTFENSVTFCNPVNIVQRVCKNRHGVVNNYTSEQLAEEFSKNRKIDVEKYIGLPTNAAHREAQLYFKNSGAINPEQVINNEAPQKTGSMRFSIIMANYNNDKYIAEAIESVVNQTFQDWELIIIDDCSKDNSLEIIGRYLNDDRIRLVQHDENKGYIGALKTGIDNVRSELFGLLDSDDVLRSDAVEIMYNAHVENADAGLIYSQFLCCDELLKPRCTGYCNDVPAGKTNLESNVISHFKTFKLADYKKTLGYGDEVLYAEDKDISYKMEEVSGLKFINKNLYYYRELPHSLGHDPQKAAIGRQNVQRARLNAYKRRGQKPIVAIRFCSDNATLIIEEMNDCYELGLKYIEEQNYNDAKIIFIAIIDVIENYLNSSCDDPYFEKTDEYKYLCMCYYACTTQFIHCCLITGDHEKIREVYGRLKKQERIELTKYHEDQLNQLVSQAKQINKSLCYPQNTSQDAVDGIKETKYADATRVPKLSVIMANYNNAEYIGDAIESVIAQTFKDWELIIVEDRSTDNSIEIIKRYLDDKRIRLIEHHANRGYIAALKTAISNVRSEIFGILDSDDVLRNDAISIMYQAHIDHPEDGLIYSQHMRCDPDLNPTFRGVGAKIVPGKTDLDKHIATAFRTFKLKDYYRTQGYDDRILYAEDRDICFKMEEVCGLRFVDDILYYNRELEYSQSHHPEKVKIGRICTQRARMNAYKRRGQEPSVGIYDNGKSKEIDVQEIQDCSCLGLEYIDEKDYDGAIIAFQAVLSSIREYFNTIGRFPVELLPQQNEWLRECFFFSSIKLIESYSLSGDYDKIKEVYESLMSDNNLKLTQRRREELKLLMSKFEKLKGVKCENVVEESSGGNEKGAPLVSVIMPVYNGQKHLKHAIESVLSQNYPQFEVIIINDGSTDSSKDIIMSFSDNRIRYFEQENKGLAATHNEGIRRSMGDFVIKVDCDDFIDPELITKHMEHFQKHPEADLVYCDDVLIEDDNGQNRIIHRREYTDRRSFIRDLFRFGYPVVPFRTCIKKSVFSKIGYFDESLIIGEDYDIMMRFAKADLNASHLPEALYYRRLEPESLSKSHSEEKIRCQFGVLTRFRETFELEELFPDVNWADIPSELKQAHGELMVAITYINICKYYMATQIPIYAQVALEHAKEALEQCQRMSSGNDQVRALADKCKQLGELFERNMVAQI